MYKRTSGVSDGSGLLLLVRGHHFFNLSYRFSWVQALRGRRARKSSENYFEIFKRMERRKPSCQGQYIIHSTRYGCRSVRTGYLGAGLSAVHDSVAAVEGERILQLGQTLLCELVS